MTQPFAEAMRAYLGGGTSVVVLNRDRATLYFVPSGMLTILPFLVRGLS